MQEVDLVQYVTDKLKGTGLPVLYFARPEGFPCISFHFFNEQGDLYGDNEIVFKRGTLQIDIFDKNNKTLSSIRAIVIDILKKAKEVIFLKTVPDEITFEDEVKLFHRILTFNFFEKEENK